MKKFILILLSICLFLIIGLLVFSYAFERAFRYNMPYDFLLQTKWVNNYFEQNGFEFIDHDIRDIDYPSSNYKKHVKRKGETRVKVRLNAPMWKIWKDKYTISVLVNYNEKFGYEFDVDSDSLSVYRFLDKYFNDSENTTSNNK